MSKPTHASLPLLTEIPQGCSLQKSSEGQRFTCIREGESIHVLADRCPHQGYPLSQGSVRDGVLTCAWHNWKFEVETGDSQFGGEGVRRFPPSEILRLLGFPPSFQLPEALPRRKAWQLAGNSLSLAAVRVVLGTVPFFPRAG